MKKQIILLILVFLNVIPLSAKIRYFNFNNAEELEQKHGVIEQVGVMYTAYGNGVASCAVSPLLKGKVVQVEIAPKVIIRGEPHIVDKIADDGFSGCSKLRMVTIPATIKVIGKGAFWNDKNLETVNILTTKCTFEKSNVKFATGIGPFLGCKKLANVTWGGQVSQETISAFIAGLDSPYVKSLMHGNGKRASGNFTASNSNSSLNSWIASDEPAPTFKDYAETKVTDAYNKWQRKKEYETAGQYADRTSAINREQKKQELFENARNEYIERYAPKRLSGKLTDYDDDYKVYTVKSEGVGNIFMQVPVADRTFVEDNWTGVDIIPTYNIIDNELKVVACEYILGGKKFIAPPLYDDKGTDYSSLEFEARQLDLDDLIETPSVDKKQKKSSLVNTAPTSGIYNPNTYALIIGNENYKYVEPVSYAVSDALTFARYCRNTLGIPQQNIMAVQDVTKGELRRTVRELQGFFEDNGQEKSLVVYYAGHGVPDEKHADALILPVDASASDTESCYSLQEFYNSLGNLDAKNVVVYMDACFTGASRGGNSLVASRAGVDFVRTQVEPRGNMVILSATSANETAQPYKSEEHGIFTYYLLDKLQKTQGNVTLGELTDYVTTKVKSQSLKVTGKKQIPSTMVSSTYHGNWRSLPVTLKTK